MISSGWKVLSPLSRSEPFGGFVRFVTGRTEIALRQRQQGVQVAGITVIESTRLG